MIRPRRAWPGGSAAIGACAALALCGCGDGQLGASVDPPRAAESHPYDPLALFNQPIPRGARSDPRSRFIVRELMRNLGERALSVATGSETPSVYVVGSDDRPYEVRDGRRRVSFRVPAAAVPGGGNDNPLVVLDPDHPRLGRHVELRVWRARIDHARRRVQGDNIGLFHYNNDGRSLNRDGSRSRAVPFFGTGTGSGLSYLAGLIRPEEVARGRIGHAIRFAYSCSDSSSRFRPPAVDSDQPHLDCGESSAETPPRGRMDMGTRLQLDPNVRCDRRTAPALPGRLQAGLETRFLRMVCRALQRYGMVMLDGTGPDGVVMYMESDRTAPWSRVAGEQRFGSYGWILRDRTTPDDGLRRDRSSGIPWHRMRVMKRSR